MSLNPFRSRQRTSVETAVMRVVEDHALPDVVRESVVQALFEGGSVPEFIVDGVLHGTGMKFERMFRYARDHYHYGLPNDTHITRNDGDAQVKAILETLHGTSVTLLYSEYGPLNNLHHARQVLTETYGYDEASNEITTLSSQVGHPVYLVDLIPLITPDDFEDDEAAVLEVWGLPATAGYTPERPAQQLIGQYRGHTPYLLDEAHPTDGTRVIHAHWINGARVDGEMDLGLGDVDLLASFFQVRYRVTGESRVRYWTYREGAGTYPTLDAVFNNAYTEPGTYWPFVIFRRNKQDRTASNRRDSNEFKTTDKLLSYINMDFAGLGEAIHENPDIGDVEQAVMMMAVPAKSQNPLEMRYLFEYFKSLSVAGLGGNWTPPASSFAGTLTQALNQLSSRNAISLRDADFRIHLSYNAIRLRVRAGRIGPVGSYSNHAGHTTFDVPYRQRVDLGDGVFELQDRVRPTRVKGQIYRKQITAVTYEEIVVDNLRLRYDIWEGHGVNADIGSDELLVPLDKTITDTFSLIDREKLLVRSLHFVFNSRVTQKVRWYQTGIFKSLLVVGAIVIAFYSGQFQAIQLAIAAGSTYAVVMAVLTVVVKALAFDIAFKYTVRTLGEEVAMTLALLALAVGVTRGIQGGSLTHTPWAAELVQVSNGLSKAAGASYQQRILDLQSDYTALLDEQQTRWEELEEVNNLLRNDTVLNPMTFVYGETPNNFYQRTIHSGNIGTLVIDSVHHFVDLALRLPDVHQTLEGEFYA